jgi:alanyl-tRNA synthetase
MKTDELREKYLAFFETKGCVRRPSDVLVPRWDPSVLFTPAGMNQFKDHFLGKVKLDFTRAATCQKCLRTGDIENVGRTAYHHTFFEMLGNFSFGDYFKREAIHWAWEFLTKKEWLGLDPQRLSVSVYLDDQEAAAIWADEIKLPAGRIKRMGEDDNFWPAGAPSSGPDGVCGPCSEIFYESGPGTEVEIWNLVFTQFNRVGPPPDNLRPLPSKNIDTGMGLERTASVLQGVSSNFDIDILLPLVVRAAEVCGIAYEKSSENGRRVRRIADHVRACTFAIHENVYPGPNKEKYVIKRLLRRAVLDGRQIGVIAPFLHKLVPQVAELMRRAYPELSETTSRVAQVIETEESNFFATIDAGLDRIERLFASMRAAGRETVSGAEAAEMYTTHGFPPELFETLAAEHNLGFDWAGFNREMEQHGIDSGAGHRVELFQSGPLDALKKTLSGTEFVGYETTACESRILGIIARNELVEQLDEIGHAAPVILVLDKTPFYGESGGQVGDTGVIRGAGCRFEVIDTQKDGAFTLHLGHLRQGRLEQGQTVEAEVDAARRQAIRRAHSATHILHHVLQRRLGKHAQQQGSKVDADWLRFDFTNPSGIPAELLAEIETDINELVWQAAKISWRSLPIAQARESGAMMLFGEKYPDIVRMVSIGEFSKELCGGTHLDNSGQVGLFKIIGEESVSAGTRRITALTGARALEHVRHHEALLSQTAAALRVPVSDVPERVSGMSKELRELKKHAASAPRGGSVSAENLLAGATEANGVKVVVSEAPGADANLMRQLIDQLRKTASPVAVLLGSAAEGKVTLVAGISRDLETRGVNAGNWIRGAAEVVGGRGGGKPDMAQAGGKHPEKLPAALSTARQDIETILKA